MKMTRRNFLSTSAVAALACGASLTAHAAGSTDENSLNFITDIFKDSTQPGEIEEATAITAEKNAEWYEKLDFSDRREFANAERGWLDNAEGRIIDGEDNRSAWDLQSYGDLNRDAPDTVNPSLWRNAQLNAKAGLFEVCDGIYQAVQRGSIAFLCQRTKPFIRLLHGRFSALRQTARVPAGHSAAVPVLPAWLPPCPKRCSTLHPSTALP